MVRTGDLGRINGEGLLEFIGRADDRVKIRGNRIELPEIESAIHAIAGIRHAVVEPIARNGREPLLIAFITQQPGQPWSPAALRRALRETLPNHMVPSQYVPIDELPFTPSGKVDRDALRKTDLAVRRADIVDAPRTDIERFLAGLWRESFDLEEIGRQDNFFDLGGDSLTAAVMAARVHGAFGIEIGLATFFDFPMLAELAQEIEDHGPAAAAPPIESSGTRPTEFPATYNQESFWALGESCAPSLTMSRCSRIAGRLDIAVLTRCISEIVERHEMLRTTFAGTKGDLRQVVHPPAKVAVPFHDLSGQPDPEIKAREIWKTEQATSFDLRRPPLARFALIKLRDDKYWLVYTAHAILLDGLSWNIFFKELGERYAAHAHGIVAPNLRGSALQCGDYALWQRDTLRPGGQRYRDSLAWWMNAVLTASYPAPPGISPCLAVVHESGGRGPAPAEADRRLHLAQRLCGAAASAQRAAVQTLGSGQRCGSRRWNNPLGSCFGRINPAGFAEPTRAHERLRDTACGLCRRARDGDRGSERRRLPDAQQPGPSIDPRRLRLLRDIRNPTGSLRPRRQLPATACLRQGSFADDAAARRPAL